MSESTPVFLLPSLLRLWGLGVVLPCPFKAARAADLEVVSEGTRHFSSFWAQTVCLNLTCMLTKATLRPCVCKTGRMLLPLLPSRVFLGMHAHALLQIMVQTAAAQLK
jgi:hypothetical protein